MSERPTQSSDSSSPQSSEDVLNAISAVETQLTNLKKAAAEHRSLEAQFSQRDLALSERESTLVAQAKARECKLDEREQELETRFEDLKQDLAVIEQERSDLEAERQRTDAELSEQKNQLDALERELVAQRADLETEAAALSEQQERVRDATARLDALGAEASERSGKLEMRAHELEQAEARLTDQAKHLESQLAQMQSSASERNEALSDAITRAERAESELKDAHARREQAEGAVLELTESLEAMRARAEQISGTIVAYEEHIEQVNARATELEASLKTLQEQLEAKQAELHEANEACSRIEAETRSRVERFEQRFAQAEQASADAHGLIEEHQARAQALEAQVEELAEQLEQARSLASPKEDALLLEEELTSGIEVRDRALAERDALIEGLKEKLATATAKIQQYGEYIKTQMPCDGERGDDAAGSTTAAYEALKARVSELESELATLAAERDALVSRSAAAGQGSAEDSALDAFLVSRRARLTRMRQSLRNKTHKIRRANELLRERFDQCETLLSRRAELAAAHQAIQEQRERSLGRRSRSVAAGAMLAFVVMLGVLFGLSWIVAEKVEPGEYAARAVISADGGERMLSDAAKAEWQSYHENLFGDPLFTETVADMLKSRGISTLGTPAAVHAAIESNLSITSGSDGQLNLEYRDLGATRTQRVLDTMAVAIARTANKTRSRRSDGAMSVVSMPSEVGIDPLDGNRLMHASVIFGGGLVLSLTFGGLVWKRMATAKSTFEHDQQLQALLSEARWQDPRFDLEAEPSSEHETPASAEVLPRKRKRRVRSD